MRRAIVLVVACGCGPDDGPVIDAISPATGEAGDEVVITGARFCGQASEVADDGACDPLPVGYVSFGIDPQIDAQVEGWLDDRLDVIVPQGVSGRVQVVLTVDGRSSNGVWFEVQ